jgi:hypothetical protein
MHQINIKKLILKKSCDAFVHNFYDVSIDFFLLLLVHQENEVPFKLAFFEEGTTFNNYILNLNPNNTRTLSSKNFEFELNNNSLKFSLILLENYTRQILSRAKMKKIIHQNTLINPSNKGIQIHQLIELKIPINIYQDENEISFNNPIFSIQFSLKQ